MTAALDVSGVSHEFGGVQALHDVSLAVPEGGFVALLGVNGAGTTTLFSLVTRLYANTSGRVTSAGTICVALPDRRWLRWASCSGAAPSTPT